MSLRLDNPFNYFYFIFYFFHNVSYISEQDVSLCIYVYMLL